jgi:hypothetical protein
LGGENTKGFLELKEFAMKRLFYGLVVLMGFTLLSCAGLKAHTERLTPVSLETVNQAKKAGENALNNLGYYLSAPLMLVANNPNTEVNERDGILFVRETNSSKLDEIKSTTKGTYVNYLDSPADKESFVISFPGVNKVFTLKFERDKTKNNYMLVAVLAPENVSINSGGILPYLCIYINYDIERQNPMYENISSGTQGIFPSPDPKPSQTKGIPLPPPPVGSQYIIDKGILLPESIVGYIQSKNTANKPRAEIETIVSVYIEEAQKEQINHDIAIAQMCEGTDYLGERTLLNNNNYGDLQQLLGKPARFDSMRLGIRAHIQQLKYYASSSVLAYPAVDQFRLKRVEKNHGKYPTLNQLLYNWVSKNRDAYINSINRILYEMYDFQNSRK